MAHWHDDGDATLWDGHDGQSFVLASWLQHGVSKFLERLETGVVSHRFCGNLAVNASSHGHDANRILGVGLLRESALRSPGNLGSGGVFSTIKPTQKVKNPAINAVLVN